MDAKLARLQDYLSQDPNNLSLLSDITDTALEFGKRDIARNAVLHALTLSPHHPQFLLRLSTIEIGTGNYRESLAITAALMSDGQAPVPVLYNHAYALVCLRRFEDAADLLYALSAAKPVDVGISSLLMRCLHYQGHLDKAVEVGLAYWNAVPSGDDDIGGQLALLYVDADRFQDAETWAKRVLARSPQNLEALVAGSTIALSKEDSTSGRAFARRAIDVQPGNGRAWSNLGLADFFDFDMASALDNLSRAVACMPEHIGTWHLLGWAQFVTGDLSAAEESFEHSRQIDDTFGDTYGGLAAVAAARRDWVKSEEFAKLARRLDPESLSSNYALILKLQQEGKGEDAMRMVDGALRRGNSPGGGSLKDMAIRIAKSRRLAK